MVSLREGTALRWADRWMVWHRRWIHQAVARVLVAENAFGFAHSPIIYISLNGNEYYFLIGMLLRKTSTVWVSGSSSVLLLLISLLLLRYGGPLVVILRILLVRLLTVVLLLLVQTILNLWSLLLVLCLHSPVATHSYCSLQTRLYWIGTIPMLTL